MLLMFGLAVGLFIIGFLLFDGTRSHNADVRLFHTDKRKWYRENFDRELTEEEEEHYFGKRD